MKIDRLGSSLSAKAGELVLNPPGEGNPPILVLNPATGLEESSGYVVGIGAELKVSGWIPCGTILERWIVGAVLPLVTVDPPGGFRDHATGGGYSLNVPESLRIVVHRVRDALIFRAGFYSLDPEPVIRKAVDSNADGYHAVPNGRHYPRATYGDFRLNREPLTTDRFTNLQGTVLN